MTIFVATLFLPYTINFDAAGSQPESPDLQRNQSAASQIPVPPTPLTDGQTVSLFTPAPGIGAAATQSPGSLIQTPGATTDHEKIFLPHVERPISLTLPRTNQQSRPALQRDPRAISRHDLHSPGWGKTFGWNQPPSRAKSPPPSSILKHAAAEAKDKMDKAAAVVSNTIQNKWGRQHKRTRTFSHGHERPFSEDSYTVEKALLGNGGLFNAIDAAAEAGSLDEKTWVGTLGCPIDVLDDSLKENIAEKLENDYDSLTVYVSDSDLNGHYEHYCKTILWPVFHYQIPDHPKSKAYEDHSWVFYVKVNEAFADRIAKNWKKGDVIWIHDYHLLLVPGLLRQRLPEAEIGFFLHTAFPSSEIFRCLAVRTELLEGILGANMIGFQTDEYCHHFLQTCSRLLNVEATKHGVILEDGRFVHVSTCPVGIDPKSLDQQRRLPEVSEWVNTITDKYRGKRIIVARDKLDNIRGVRQKILSYELFLNKYPEYKDKVVLIQIATSSTEDPELSATVADIVTRVNSIHSTLAHQPLVFLKQDIDFAQYLALLTVAECLMITSLREGMNLTSHEFVICQDGQFADTKHAPLILSEFTGSATVFGHNAILVNPWHYSQCAQAIKTALDMQPDERERRWKNMHDIVVKQNAVQWFDTYTKALDHAWKEHSIRDSTSVPRLSLTSLKPKYLRASKRLIILDYEGTLASWGSPTDIILTTPKRSIDVLNDLIEDKRNTVYVMSSRMPEEMERLFSPVSGLGMIAENGGFLMEPGSDEWDELADLDNFKNWKDGVRSILKYYVERIEGSRIEERHCSLIFDYSDAEDRAGAFKQAGECANHINDACRGQHVSAVPIEDGLFISEMDVNKGLATQVISDRMEKRGVPLPDFLLVIGDSREDEYAFAWAHKLEKAGKVRDVVTVTLGARSTEASATLTQGVTGVLSILEKLVRSSQQS
ncbi:Trehalose-6-P synthase/phosphatase complex subunit [Exophiala dermatitidis]|uniref:Alpha,alpha-trehalose-phosphate synthase (UDP-forming) n=2 Tax=Exophiala dermatitidis TaxID=5970 RepID=H6BMJ4_EXODN|nr:alpha,alpha-trehalose-phosphate synthase (UDP-forming) [Exophiala dermatitidis NIH/UT8656]KAJ4514735.1 Trehalose-6-P synthase/phosphatase complex subunit [Exophiala dermatitidis]EHY52076.1 alpha,alpha-trehalose-phosphate synthase (UDP-forming) [Exophiala dermatitidis NIH/UT8656]KAJ4518185.1 Trehalose-6-P synthase/phosphatase complex subunit [Exophiala dermatitidis]KAJ4521083.1 Trehalose-6-P synthase/phosphatase complex subunit [Exophiala dermatitidis]KAJ4547667.1 Trehalose-6-P synthase/phos